MDTFVKLTLSVQFLLLHLYALQACIPRLMRAVRCATVSRLQHPCIAWCRVAGTAAELDLPGGSRGGGVQLEHGGPGQGFQYDR